MGRMTLSARGADVGQSEVILELPEYTGQKITIAFDPKYLVGLLKAVEGEPTAVLELTDGDTPAVVRVGEDTVFLVMPLSN